MSPAAPSTHDGSQRQSIPPERRIVALIIGLLCLAAIIGGFTPGYLDASMPHPVALFVIGLGFAISERLIFHVEARTEAVSYSPSDVVLGLGIVFFNPLILIAVRIAGATFANLFWRRTAFIKWAFNMSNFVFETTLAFAVFRLAPIDRSSSSIWLWIALLVAVFVALVSSGIAVAGAVSCFEGGFIGRARREIVQSPAVHLPGATVAAAVGVSMLVELWLGFVIATVAPIVWWVVRSHGALRREFDDLSSVHLFSSAVGHEADTTSILERGATQIAANLRAGSAAIRIWNNAGDQSEFSLGPNELLDHLPTRPADCPDDLLELTGSQAGAIIVPLGDERGVLGVIGVADRHGVTDRFDASDQSRLNTMLGQLVIAIRKSQLYTQIQYDATHDRLTGLANRSFFEAWVNDAAALPTHQGAVYLIDLDRFKEVNDAFGHDAGDRLLQACADRIKAAVPDGSVVARFGGDEFAIYVPDVGPDSSEQIAAALTTSVDEPFALTEASVAVTSSIGIAHAPSQGDTASLLLRRADIAMYDSKRRFSRYTVYHPGLDENDAVRLSMIADLRQALTDDDLDVHYQPKVDIETGRLKSAEALVRWTHAEHGPVRPDIFVELAEQAGMIEPLTDTVMGKAVAAAASWQQRGWRIGVAVNISAQSLLDERLIEMVAKHLKRTGLDPKLLTLEITESTMMGDPERTHRMLHRLTDVGVDISVDDFGTGFSSLSSLRQLPVSELKIDRSFVSAMDTNHHDAVIVRSTIDLAHNLGLRIVAEGVETEEVLSELRDLRCDLAQGYGISKPMPYDQTTAWIASRTPPGDDPIWRWGDDRGHNGTELDLPVVPRDAGELDQIESKAANNSSNAVI